MPTLWEHFTETEQLKLAKEPDPELESEEETASVVDSGVIKIDNILTIIISATEAKLNKTKQIYIVVSSLPDKVKKKVKGDTTVDIYAHYTSLFEDEDDKTIVAKIVNNMAKSVTDLDASEEKHSNDSGEEIVSISFDEEKMIVEDDSQCLEVSYVLQEQPEILNNAIVPSKRGRSNSEIQKWLLSMENFSREMEQESNPRIMKQKKALTRRKKNQSVIDNDDDYNFLGRCYYELKPKNGKFVLSDDWYRLDKSIYKLFHV